MNLKTLLFKLKFDNQEIDAVSGVISDSWLSIGGGDMNILDL